MMPQLTPITKATAVATKPTNRDTRAPYKILLNKSRPKVSVPRKNVADGG